MSPQCIAVTHCGSYVYVGGDSGIIETYRYSPPSADETMQPLELLRSTSSLFKKDGVVDAILMPTGANIAVLHASNNDVLVCKIADDGELEKFITVPWPHVTEYFFQFDAFITTQGLCVLGVAGPSIVKAVVDTATKAVSCSEFDVLKKPTKDAYLPFKKPSLRCISATADNKHLLVGTDFGGALILTNERTAT